MHEIVGLLRVSLPNRLEDREMFVEDAAQPAGLALDRHAVKAHPHGDMVLQGRHRGREIAVLRRDGDGEVELEIRILSMDLRIGRVAPMLQRVADLRQGLRVMAFGREYGG